MTWHGWLSAIVDFGLFISIVFGLLLLVSMIYDAVHDVVRAYRRWRVRRQIQRDRKKLDLQKIADLRAWGVNRWDGRR